MVKHFMAACLLLMPVSAALGEELFGLNSPAIDISAPVARNQGQYAAAFTSIGQSGQPNGITIQSRYTEPDRNWYSCTATLPLPTRATRRISHPALSTSGWVFASATEDSTGLAGWKLYAARRQGGAIVNYCSGWDSWIDLGRFSNGSGQRAVASAPDAVVVGPETYAFVTSEGGFIDFRRFDGERWRPWASLQGTGFPRYRAGSKPAVAAYTFDYLGDVTILHIFWLDGARNGVFHERAYPFVGSPFSGLFEVSEPSWRAFGSPAGRARTACSAGPELIAPAPLFIVCGSTGPNRVPTYAIARFRATLDGETTIPWMRDEAVELIGTDAWISRNLFGGSSAPSLGPTGLADAPLMFVASGSPCVPERFAPFADRPAPASCLGYSVASERYLGRGNALRSWEATRRLDFSRWGSRY